MASDLGVEPEALRSRARRLVAAAPDAFTDAATQVADLPSDLPHRLTTAVAARSARCARLI
jgi:hypothetical protein